MTRRSSPSLDSNLKFTKISIYLKDDCTTSIMTVYRKPTHTDEYLHFAHGNTTSNTNVVWFTPWCTNRWLLLPMIPTLKNVQPCKICPLCKWLHWVDFQNSPLPLKKQNLLLSFSKTKHQFVYVCHKWEEHQGHYSGSLDLMGFTSSTSLLLRSMYWHMQNITQRNSRDVVSFITSNENNAWTIIGKSTGSPGLRIKEHWSCTLLLALSSAVGQWVTTSTHTLLNFHVTDKNNTIKCHAMSRRPCHRTKKTLSEQGQGSGPPRHLQSSPENT